MLSGTRTLYVAGARNEPFDQPRVVRDVGRDAERASERAGTVGGSGRSLGAFVRTALGIVVACVFAAWAATSPAAVAAPADSSAAAIISSGLLDLALTDPDGEHGARYAAAATEESPAGTRSSSTRCRACGASPPTWPRSRLSGRRGHRRKRDRRRPRIGVGFGRAEESGHTDRRDAGGRRRPSRDSSRRRRSRGTARSGLEGRQTLAPRQADDAERRMGGVRDARLRAADGALGASRVSWNDPRAGQPVG